MYYAAVRLNLCKLNPNPNPDLCETFKLKIGIFAIFYLHFLTSSL